MRYLSTGLLTLLVCIASTATVSAQKVQKSDRLRNVLHTHQPMLRAGFEKQLDSTLYFSKENDTWIVDDKEAYAYRTDGLIEELIDYDLAENGKAWEATDKVVFYYNAEALLERIASLYWDGDSETWVEEEVQTSNYDNDGNLIEINYSYYDEDINDWVQDDKTTYSYTTNGDVLEEVSSYYDEDVLDWVAYYKTEYSYNTDNKPTENISYTYDEDKETWLTESKAVHTLSKEQQIETTLSSNWNSENSEWEENSLVSYTYDSNGNPKTEAYAYGKQDGDWLNTNRFGYKYNLTIKAEDVMSPPFDFFLPDQTSEIMNMYTGYIGESFNNGSWGEDSKTEMFYSDAPSSIALEATFEELAEVVVQGGQLLLSSKGQTGLHYTLLLTNGQVIRSGMLSEFGSIGLQVPAHGVYLLQVRTNKAAGTQKVLVR